MSAFLSSDYWAERYRLGQTGWDLGAVSPAVRRFFEQTPLDKAQTRILVPGAGNGHEVAYLWAELGFEQVFLCDWASEPLEAFAQRYPDFPKAQLLCADFFALEENQYDLILEQTFFCALNPDLREAYAQKVAALLRAGGRLEGLWFGIEFDRSGPPFGGCAEAYWSHLAPHFASLEIAPCLDSVKPRQGTELWISARKA